MWIVAIRDGGGLGEFERLILQQAVTVVALELMRRRVVRDTERRLAGDVLAEVVEGELDEAELRGRLRPFGIGDQAAVLVFSVAEPAGAEEALERALVEAGAPGAGRDARASCCARSSTARRETRWSWRRACAPRWPRSTAPCAPPAAGWPTPARCGAASTRRATRSRRPRCSTAARPRSPPGSDLGALQFLLAVQDDEALRLYSDSVLGPIENGEGEYGGELLRSLEAFVEHNGQWERAARELFCHRHTLRYRIRRVEQLTGRDLSSARDRIEFWLALKAQGAGDVSAPS